MTIARFLPLFIAFGSSLRALAQQAPAGLPYEPAQLLTTLPDAPPQWTLTRSEADNTLGNWLSTRATRVFQAPPTPATDATGSTTPPLGQIEISVTDTAGFTPSLAPFADFTPEKGGIVEKKFIGSLPAIIVSGEDGTQHIQVLVSARYIIGIAPNHLPQARIEDWLKSFHFDRLPTKSSAPATRPHEFQLSHVDELHPQKNRSYFVSTTNSQRVADFLKTLPSEPVDTAQSK